MLRRDFILACGASALTASLPATLAGASPRFYFSCPAGRTRRAARLKAGALPENRISSSTIRFAGTPCFLLNLGKPTKTSAAAEKPPTKQIYEWPGGVGAGPQASSPIPRSARHRLTYPTREISFISYRGEKIGREPVRTSDTFAAPSTASTILPKARKVLAGPRRPSRSPRSFSNTIRRATACSRSGPWAGSCSTSFFPASTKFPPRPSITAGHARAGRRDPLHSERAGAVLQAAGEVLKA